ncbi:hypothetical protein ACSBOB_16805 [Mesorhizobium sp. ASY16-5R]|uniref:hypothetical protein n=1 Tax=Mesorhizobium sp. ASY16-5R TaxID=3445772 RepID=UPI003FA0190F
MPESWKFALEIAKLLVGASVPAIIAYYGTSLNKRLKSIDQAQWQNRKIIEIRLDIYKDVSPKLNSMYCFCRWVGDWKETTPVDMIKLKRQTDKTINVYRHLFSESFYNAYNAFIHTVFKTFTGAGEDAKIRSEVSGGNGDRRVVFKDSWKPEWDGMFSPGKMPSRVELETKYLDLMQEFRSCIGLKEIEIK